MTAPDLLLAALALLLVAVLAPLGDGPEPDPADDPVLPPRRRRT